MKKMKFKSNTFAYYGVTCLQVFLPALWIGLLFLIPIRNQDDFIGYIISLLAVELLLFTCSPIAHRTVTIDEINVTEKWFCFTFNQMKLSKITEVGVCTYLSGNHVRQFAFVSTEKMSDEEVIQFDQMGIFRRKSHKGRFITIEHPQKGLDDCIMKIAKRNRIKIRQFSA